jgi:hypothetical protein
MTTSGTALEVPFKGGDDDEQSRPGRLTRNPDYDDRHVTPATHDVAPATAHLSHAA